MVTIVDIPTNSNFRYPDNPATIDGVANALTKYAKVVSRDKGTKRDLAQAFTADKNHFIVIATEAKNGR